MMGQYRFIFDNDIQAKLYVEKVVLGGYEVAILRLGNVVHVIDGSRYGQRDALRRLASVSQSEFSLVDR